MFSAIFILFMFSINALAAPKVEKTLISLVINYNRMHPPFIDDNNPRERNFGNPILTVSPAMVNFVPRKSPLFGACGVPHFDQLISVLIRVYQGTIKVN